MFKNITITPLLRTSGHGIISNQTLGALMSIDNVPTSVQYVVEDMTTGKILISGVSNSDGTFSIEGLNPSRTYRINIYDPTGQAKACAALNGVTPVVV